MILSSVTKVFEVEIKMSGTEKAGSGTTKTPADFLKSIRGRPVVVKLNSGVDYRGILACLDGYMNIAMEQTEEYVNGQLKNKYGDAFIRGNNDAYSFERLIGLPCLYVSTLAYCNLFALVIFSR
ncbi:Sm-like protein LSM6A [Glycine soja]